MSPICSVGFRTSTQPTYQPFLCYQRNPTKWPKIELSPKNPFKALLIEISSYLHMIYAIARLNILGMLSILIEKTERSLPSLRAVGSTSRKPACKPMKPTGWPPARSGTILRLGEKRARRGCSAYASESDIHNSSIFIRHSMKLAHQSSSNSINLPQHGGMRSPALRLIYLLHVWQ